MIRQKIKTQMPIERIDETVVNYINNIIKPSVTIYDGSQYQVPVIFNGAERWVQVRRRTHLVDEQGNVVYPIISLSRTSIKLGEELLLNRKWTFGYGDMIQVANKYSKQRPFRSNDGFGNIRKKTEYYRIGLPLYVQGSYQFQIYTDTMQSMNKLIESFILYANRWWIYDQYRVKINITDFSNTIELEASSERLVKTSFTANFACTILPETYQPIQIAQVGKPIRQVGINVDLQDQLSQTNKKEISLMSVTNDNEIDSDKKNTI